MSSHKPDKLLQHTFLHLMIINILMGLVQPCNQLVDSMLTGSSLGLDAMKAFSLFFPVGSLVTALGCVFSIGTQINCAHMLGRGKPELTRMLVRTSLSAAAGFSVILGVFIFAFSSNVAIMVGANSAAVGQISATSDCLRGYAIGIPAVFLMNIMLSLLQLEGKKRMVILLAVCNLAVNALMDVANIVVFKMGLFGMTLATSIANLAVFAVLLIYFLFFSNMFHFSLSIPDRKDLGAIIKHGSPSLSYYGSLVVRSAFFNFLIIRALDPVMLAVMLVVNSFTSLVDSAIGGTGDAVLLMGGVIYGEKDTLALKKLLKTAVIAGSALLLVIAVLSAAAAVPLAGLFSDNNGPEFIELTARAIRLTALCFVPDVIACVLKKYIQAVGRAVYTSVANILCNIVYVCGAAAVLVRVMGADGLFLSYLVCYTLILVTHNIYALYLARQNGRKGMEIFLYLPKDYEVMPEDICEFTIRGTNDCIDASIGVSEVCRQKHIDNRRTLFLALFVEEISMNIVEHGFRPEKNSFISMKLIFSKDSIMLNVKDNCRHFDPKRYYEMLAPKGDPEKGIGIKIIMGLSKKAVYTNSFNLNNLMIEV